jgi:pseudouridine kinase
MIGPTEPRPSGSGAPGSRFCCIGGAHLDRHGLLRVPSVSGSSNPATVRTDFGGVAHNVAHNLARLGCAVRIVSRVGDDGPGRHVRDHLSAAGVDAILTVSTRYPTASYTAILEPSGELVIGLADMDIYDEITPAVLEPVLPHLRECDLWFLETNLPGDTISWLLEAAGNIPVAVDAISVAKCRRLIPLLGRIPLLFCNAAQAKVLGKARAAGSPAGVISDGTRGIAVFQNGKVLTMPALPAHPRDVTGAGDALVAGTLYGLGFGEPLDQAVRWGLAAAAVTVESEFAAVPHLTRELLEARLV